MKEIFVEKVDDRVTSHFDKHTAQIALRNIFFIMNILQHNKRLRVFDFLDNFRNNKYFLLKKNRRTYQN